MWQQCASKGFKTCLWSEFPTQYRSMADGPSWKSCQSVSPSYFILLSVSHGPAARCHCRPYRYRYRGTLLCSRATSSADAFHYLLHVPRDVSASLDILHVVFASTATLDNIHRTVFSAATLKHLFSFRPCFGLLKLIPHRSCSMKLNIANYI